MNPSDEPEEEQLPGSVGAVRVGSTVRKGAGPWTPTVHALLRFLRDADFDLAPEPLGLDGRGREGLTWLDGTAGTRPWPAVLLRDEGVVALVRVVRRYHDVVRDFDPGPGRHAGASGAVPSPPARSCVTVTSPRGTRSGPRDRSSV